jgi:uncharacterized membrane protein SpoIIM required for sporulation
VDRFLTFYVWVDPGYTPSFTSKNSIDALELIFFSYIRGKIQTKAKFRNTYSQINISTFSKFLTVIISVTVSLPRAYNFT